MISLLANVPPKINPVAFTIGNLEVRWYAIILTCAMLVALFVLYKLAKGKGFTGDFILEVFLWTIPLAIVAARLGYCLPRAEYWTSWEGFNRVFKIWEGGLTILSGIFGGLLGIFIACKHKKVALFDVVDLVIPALLIGQAIGRWGNFMNEELFGVQITDPAFQWMPFAVYIHNPGGGLEPGWYAASFFYESVMNLVMGILMLLLVKQNKYKPSELSFIYLAWYGLLRGILEFIKVGAFQLGGKVGGAQVFSFCMAVAGFIMVILIKKGVVRFMDTEKLRLKKNLEYVVNDAYVDGKFSEAFARKEEEEEREEKERKNRNK